MIQFSRKVVRKALGPLARNLIGTITHVKTTEYIAALTFDDGPHPEYTPQLLDILARYDAKATFFMVGEAASKHPELVRRVSLEGHAIGNHTWNHLALPSINRKDRWKQIWQCKRALSSFGNLFFRPPYGEQTIGSHFDTLCLGYKVILWNLDVGDWWDPDPHRMAEKAITEIQPGSIFLFHDSIFDAGQPKHEIELSHGSTVERQAMLITLDLLLRELSGRFRFVTVPELLKRGHPYRKNWYVTWG
jgi:peptidoglycan-N-acetylglucosamine deacetylase